MNIHRPKRLLPNSIPDAPDNIVGTGRRGRTRRPALFSELRSIDKIYSARVEYTACGGYLKQNDL